MTSGGRAAVARATAAVFADGRRAGSAVLVAPRYLVTAQCQELKGCNGSVTDCPVA